MMIQRESEVGKQCSVRLLSKAINQEAVAEMRFEYKQLMLTLHCTAAAQRIHETRGETCYHRLLDPRISDSRSLGKGPRLYFFFPAMLHSLSDLSPQPGIRSRPL